VDAWYYWRLEIFYPRMPYSDLPERREMTPTNRERLGKRVTKRGYVTVHSDVLNLDFTVKVSDPRSPRLEMVASAHEELHRQRTIKPRKR